MVSSLSGVGPPIGLTQLQPLRVTLPTTQIAPLPMCLPCPDPIVTPVAAVPPSHVEATSPSTQAAAHGNDAPRSAPLAII